MDLDDLKATWSEMSEHVEKKSKLTNIEILEMTQVRYKKKFNNIAYSEIFGSIVSAFGAMYIIYNFDMLLNNWLNITSGILSLAMLIILPIFSMMFLAKWNKKVNVVENNYKQTMISFAKIRKKFRKLEKFSYALGLGSMFIVLPAFSKIMNNRDLLEERYLRAILISLPIGVVITVIFVYFLMKYYNKNLDEADDILKELEQDDEE